MYKKKMAKMLALGQALYLVLRYWQDAEAVKGKKQEKNRTVKLRLPFLYGISFSRRGCRIWWMLLKRRIRIFMLR